MSGDALRGRAILGAHMVGFLQFVGAGMIRAVVAVYAARTLRLSPGLVGAVLSAQGVPAFAGMSLGALVQRFGEVRSLQAGGLLMILSGALFLGSRHVMLAVAGMILVGAAGLAVWIGAQTYVTMWAEGPALNRVVGTFGFWTALGITVGPLLGAFLLDLGGPAAGFAGYIAAGAVILAATMVLPAPIPARAAGPAALSRPRPQALLHDRAIQAAFIFSTLAIFVVTLRSTFYLVFLTGRGWSASVVGVLMAAGGVSSTFVRPLMAGFASRVGMSGLILLGSVAAAAGFGLTPAAHHYAVLMALSVLGGLGAGLHQPVSLSLVAGATSPQDRGVALGLRSTVNQLAVSVAPALFGIAAERTGTGGAFYVVGLICLAAGLWAWRAASVGERAPRAPAIL